MFSDVRLFAIILLSITSCLSFKTATTLNDICHIDKTDCRPLVTGNRIKYCFIYNKTRCANFNFSNWSTAPLSVLTTEKKAPFIVNVETYFHNRHPAYNITIRTLSTDISGYVLLLAEILGPYNSCRIFDFRNSAVSLAQPFSLYYDCYYNLNSQHIYHYSLKVRSLPDNKQVEYWINVPHPPTTENFRCEIETTVMVNIGGLPNERVEVKFEKVPDNWNVLLYNVSLHNANCNFVATNIVNQTYTNETMLTTSFENVGIGLYRVKVTPITFEGKRCMTAETWQFEVSKHATPNSYSIVWIVGIVVPVIFIIVAVVFFVYKSKSVNGFIRTSHPLCLIVYFDESEEHRKLVWCFARYLQNSCNIEVFADVWLQNEDPNAWILNCVSIANFIIIILSNKMRERIDNINKSMENTRSPYGDLFPLSWSVISEEVTKPNNGKKFVKVYFDNFDTKSIHDCLKLAKFGKQFHLMKQFSQFLCHLYDITPVLNFLFPIPQSEERENLQLAIEQARKSDA